MMKKCLYYMVSVLLLAGSVLTACSEIEAQKEEFTVDPGQKYMLSVMAVKSGPSTKALYYDESSQTLTATWENNDEIEVWADGSYVTKILAKIVGETASKTEFISTEALSSQQADAILNANEIILKYHSADYDKQDGTLEGIADNCDYAEAKVTATGVENGVITTTEARFEGKQAIVRFKMLNQKEEAINVETLSVTYGTGSTLKSFEFKMKEAASIFFVAIPEGTEVDLAATAGGRTYAYSKVLTNGAKLANGGFYPIKVHMEGQPKLGDPYYSDGTWATCNKHADDAQVVGIVVYVGGGAVTEEAAGFGHGLVMALKDASQGAKWDTIAKGSRSGRFNDKVTGAELALVNFGGKEKTEALAAQDNYTAAKLAKNYSVSVNGNKCSGWFLPSSGQWISVVYGLCGAEYPVKTAAGPGNDTWWLNGNNNEKKYWGTTATDIARVLYHPQDGEKYAHERINDALSAACAGDASKYDEIITVIGTNGWISYWTSSESGTNEATRMNFGVETKDERKAGFIYSSIKADKKDKGTQYRVRPFLAF